MPVTHEPWLVALSVIVAIQGAYVGLSLAVQIGGTIGVRRRWLFAGAALSLGVAIWSMHFVAMLAARLPFPVDYLVFPTLLSFLVCVLVVGAAVFAVGAGPLTLTRLVAASVFMGLGIVSMHYIGMAALHDSAHMTHDPYLVGAGVAIAIATSGLALRLATRHRPHRRFSSRLSRSASPFPACTTRRWRRSRSTRTWSRCLRRRRCRPTSSPSSSRSSPSSSRACSSWSSFRNAP